MTGTVQKGFDVKCNDVIISRMFGDYVRRMQEAPRHTEAAQMEADKFDCFCESEFPKDFGLQVNLYDMMMSCAVEYEESGFIAGFKTAIALITGREEFFPDSGINSSENRGQEVHTAVKAV